MVQLEKVALNLTVIILPLNLTEPAPELLRSSKYVIYCPHFIVEETEGLNNLSKVIQLATGRHLSKDL